MRKILAIVPLMFAVSAFAATGSITKTAKPSNTYGTAGPDFSYATFPLSSVDFPAGTLNKPKQLISIQYWWYPYQTGTTDKVELCYDRPLQVNHQYCTDISNSQTGSSTAFNAYQFDFNARVYIKHTVSGTTSPRLPNLTSDKVIVNYSY